MITGEVNPNREAIIRLVVAGPREQHVPGLKENHEPVHIPVDTVVMPLQAKAGELPLMIEAKSGCSR